MMQVYLFTALAGIVVAITATVISTNRKFGVFIVNLIAGLIGAFAGGKLFLHFGPKVGHGGLMFMLSALIAAVVLVLIANALMPKGSKTNP